MQTLILILILFLISIFSVLLYFKTKKQRLAKLESGTCPRCNATPKIFIDQTNNRKIKVDVITSRILKNHGCSGVTEVEFSCSSCGLKEVHQTLNGGCNF